MNTLFKRFFLFCVASVSFVQAVQAADAPDALIRNTSREVLEVLKRDNGQNERKLRELVEQKVLPHFDFSHMTRLAVGKYWQEASSSQQKELTHEFKTMLVKTYTTAFSSSKSVSSMSIEVKPLRGYKAGDEQTVVQSEVINNGKVFPVVYRLKRTNNGWKVYDVLVEGASLVTNYRTTFGQTIQNGGVDALIRQLRAKNSNQSQGSK